MHHLNGAVALGALVGAWLWVLLSQAGCGVPRRLRPWATPRPVSAALLAVRQAVHQAKLPAAHQEVLPAAHQVELLAAHPAVHLAHSPSSSGARYLPPWNRATPHTTLPPHC